MHMLKKIVLYISLFLLTPIFSSLLLAQAGDVAPEIKEGKALFTSNCAACHAVKQKLVGPALYNVEQRWSENAAHAGIDGKTWLYKWIKNSSQVLKDGNPYANSVFNEYKVPMNAFPQLSDEDIADILKYVQAEGDGLLKPKPAVEDAASAGTDGNVASGGADTQQTKTLLFVLVGLLLVIAFVLNRVNNILNRLILVKQNKPLLIPVPFYKNKTLITTLVLAVIILVGYTTVNNAIDLGRQQGYAPEQPIKYSHELHAGQNKIECQYCHTSAAKGKHANIPSANVCMNCHKAVQEGPKYSRKEIAKIYAAIGFDPYENTFVEDYASLSREEAEAIYIAWLEDDENIKHTEDDIQEVLAQVQKPIEWVRIHNLPDHVYFNHSQHVTVGQVACQTCHGEIQTMEVVAQHAPLSMGWCISCHREREVKFAQNDYYQVYKKYHEKLSANGEKFTVEKMGGTECQKCHY